MTHRDIVQIGEKNKFNRSFYVALFSRHLSLNKLQCEVVLPTNLPEALCRAIMSHWASHNEVYLSVRSRHLRLQALTRNIIFISSRILSTATIALHCKCSERESCFWNNLACLSVILPLRQKQPLLTFPTTHTDNRLKAFQQWDDVLGYCSADSHDDPPIIVPSQQTGLKGAQIWLKRLTSQSGSTEPCLKWPICHLDCWEPEQRIESLWCLDLYQNHSNHR